MYIGSIGAVTGGLQGADSGLQDLIATINQARQLKMQQQQTAAQTALAGAQTSQANVAAGLPPWGMGQAPQGWGAPQNSASQNQAMPTNSGAAAPSNLTPSNLTPSNLAPSNLAPSNLAPSTQGMGSQGMGSQGPSAQAFLNYLQQTQPGVARYMTGANALPYPQAKEQAEADLNSQRSLNQDFNSPGNQAQAASILSKHGVDRVPSTAAAMKSMTDLLNLHNAQNTPQYQSLLQRSASTNPILASLLQQNGGQLNDQDYANLYSAASTTLGEEVNKINGSNAAIGGPQIENNAKTIPQWSDTPQEQQQKMQFIQSNLLKPSMEGALLEMNGYPKDAKGNIINPAISSQRQNVMNLWKNVFGSPYGGQAAPTIGNIQISPTQAPNQGVVPQLRPDQIAQIKAMSPMDPDYQQAQALLQAQGVH